MPPTPLLRGVCMHVAVRKRLSRLGKQHNSAVSYAVCAVSGSPGWLLPEGQYDLPSRVDEASGPRARRRADRQPEAGCTSAGARNGSIEARASHLERACSNTERTLFYAAPLRRKSSSVSCVVYLPARQRASRCLKNPCEESSATAAALSPRVHGTGCLC
ncbi:unnamed protein product [Ectocarpus sp. 8 AP-2014]